MRPVCVIGLGLIGGSVLRGALASGRPAWGATASAADADAAIAEGYRVEALVTALERAHAEDALVVLAVPLPTLDNVLRDVARHAPAARLTDTVSVKTPVVDAVARLAPSARYVGGHPMAGTAGSGWTAGSTALFADAAWVVSATSGADLSVWADVAGLALGCGAHVVPADARDHDAAVARISHLPHVFAAILADVGATGGPLAMSLAASSFRDATRVAGTRVDLVRAMCEGNREALLPVVDDALGKLGAARGALASTGSLNATLTEGHEAHARSRAEHGRDGIRVRIDLGAPDAVTALRRVGQDGGRVVAVDGAIVTAEIVHRPSAPG